MMKENQDKSFFDQAIVKELEQCLGSLDQMDEDNLHGTIHLLRKSMKRLRGWLRAARPAENSKSYNRELSSIGKEISELRDSTSAIECMLRLQEAYCHAITPAIFEQINITLQEQRKKLTQSMRPAVMRVHARLASLHNNYAPFGFTEINQLLPGIQETYAVSQRAFQQVIEKNDGHVLHEWRKRNKDLQFQLLLFPDLAPFFQDLHAAFDRLSTLLGHDQDLYLLEAAVPSADLDEKQKHLVEALIQFEHRSLIEEAVMAGKKIYNSSPKTFIHQIANHL